MATAKGKRATTTKKPAAKKSTGKSTSSRSKKVTKSQFPIPKPAIGIVLLILGAFALFSIISGTNATVTVFFRRVFNGMFGAVGPMVALYMVVAGLQLILEGRMPIPKIAWLQFALLMLALVTLLQAFEISNLRSYVLQKYLQQDYYSAFVWRSYDTSAVSGGGGGYLGMLVAYPLEKYLSLTGTVMVLMLAICGMIFWMVRTLAPGVLDRAGEWFAQLREDMAIRREEREAAREEEQERRAADAALLVPLPGELMEEAPQQPTNGPKRVATGKRVAKPEPQRSAPMQQPLPQRNVQTQMNMEWHDEPEEMPPQEYRQPPRQVPQQPAQEAPIRPGVPARSVKRPKLYLEDDMPPSPAEEAYTEYDAERAKFATRPSRKIEGVLPDIVLKRRAQLDDEYGTVEGFEEVSYAPAEEIYTGPEAFEEEVYEEMPVEPEYDDLPYDDSPFEMDEEPPARPAASPRKYVIQNPADRQPQLDPETRLDRPDFRPMGEEPIHEMPQPVDEYRKPPFSLLEHDEKHMRRDTREADVAGAAKLEETLKSFGVSANVIKVVHGPAITRYELQPAPGVKVAKITGLTDDIALNMAAVGVRIEAPIPGKAAVGIEIANESIETVHLRDVLESDDAMRSPSKLAVALGKDVAGKRIIADLARMPHLLIAGATGAGKSVCINTLITSIIYRATPEEVRLILVDPKKVELAVYDGIPHLLVPVVTDPKKASGALNWAVMEMDERYKLFAAKGVRDIKGYNAHRDPEAPLMPQIVVIIDELSDLMLVAPGEVEEAICRIAQLARACGIHLVIATQRPSVNVITGIIKANIPSRIAFAVSSQVDSRTILDSAGAEKLLGKGDMLFAPSGGGKPQRVQGCFVSDDEVQRVTSFVKERHETEYNQAVLEALEARDEAEEAASPDDIGDTDALFEQAVEIAIESGQASISMLQRRMRVGYARAGRIIDEMARQGIIGQADGAKPREVLMTREEFNIMFQK